MNKYILPYLNNSPSTFFKILLTTGFVPLTFFFITVYCALFPLKGPSRRTYANHPWQRWTQFLEMVTYHSPHISLWRLDDTRSNTRF